VSGQQKWAGLVWDGGLRTWLNKTTLEVRYYISSLPAVTCVLAHAVAHMGIEKVHWTWMSLSEKMLAGFAAVTKLRSVAANFESAQRETRCKSIHETLSGGYG